jgi:hypothetical protein
MKKARGSRPGKHVVAEGADEYRFDYTKSKPNRFAGALARDAVVVVLDPDVAKVFRNSRRVNAILRASIPAAKKRRPRKAG